MVLIRIQRSTFDWWLLSSPSYCNSYSMLLFNLYKKSFFFILRCWNWLLSQALYKSNITKCFKAKNSCTRWISKLFSPTPLNSPTWLEYMELGLHKDSCKWKNNCAHTPHIRNPVVYVWSHTLAKKHRRLDYLHDFSLFKLKIPSCSSGGQGVAHGTVKYKTKSAAQKSAFKLNAKIYILYVNSSIGMYYMQ